MEEAKVPFRPRSQRGAKRPRPCYYECFDSDNEYNIPPDTGSDYDPEEEEFTTGKKQRTLPFNNKENRYKETFNDYLTNLIMRSSFDFSSCTAIVLDSYSMRTTNALRGIGFDKKNISTVECDEKVYRQHVKSGVDSHFMPLEKFTKGYSGDGFNVLCFDICGQVKTLKPCVMNALENGMFNDGTILAITVSKRTTGGTFKSHRSDFLEEMQMLAAKKGFKVAESHDYSYGGGQAAKQSPMHSEFFIFKKL